MRDLTQEQLYQRIVENAPDAVIVADHEGIIRLWNAGATVVFGYGADEVLGQTLDIIIPERLRQRHGDGYRRVMVTGETKYGREMLAVPAIRKDGTRISVEFSIALLRDEHGDPIGTTAIMRDVTERWERDRALRQQLAAAEARLKPMASLEGAASSSHPVGER